MVFVVAQTAFGMRWTSPQALQIAVEALGGAFIALVTATAFGDVAALSRAQVAERAFERSWAVIIISFGIDLVASVGIIGLEAKNALYIFLGSGVLLMASTLIFAPVDATISNDDWWWVLPSALSRSILTAWRANVFSRAFIVMTLVEIVPFWLQVALQSLLATLHVGRAALLASGLSVGLLLPVVQTFATFVYLDAIGYESKRPCSE